MSKVITFSQAFPKSHPRSGQPTFFVEKIFAGLADDFPDWKMPKEFVQYEWHEYYNCENAKIHTIRQGRRFKVGDYFSPRVWSGKPYASKQVVFSVDLEIKTILDFEIRNGEFIISGKNYGTLTPLSKTLQQLAKNDGLTAIELMQWFADGKGKQVDFEGQIISWFENITY